MTEASNEISRIAGASDGKLELEKGIFADDRLVQEELEYLAGTEGMSEHLTAIVEGLKAKAQGLPPQPVNQNYTIGLALSGGGIRSAVVSLGVMQHLAGKGLLAQVDYLSTVSGGGFIGSALSWWLHNAAKGTGDTAAFDLGANFPFGTEAPDELAVKESYPLTYLRESGRYLVPGNGHGIAAGIAVVLRAIFLNLLVWIPLVALVFLFLGWTGYLPFLSGLPATVANVAEQPMRMLNGSSGFDGVMAVYPPTYLLLLLAAMAVVAMFVIVSVNLSVQSWLERGETAKDLFKWASVQTWLENVRTPTRWILAAAVSLAFAALFFLIALYVVWATSAVLQTGILESKYAELSFVANLIFGLFIFLFGVVYFHDENMGYRLRNKFSRMAVPFLFVCLFDILALLSPRLTSPDEWWAGAVVWLWGVANIILATGFFIFASYLLGHAIRNILHTFDTSVRYGARRQFERVFGMAFVAALACTAVGVLPIIVGQINASLMGGPSAGASLFLGIASAIWGHYRIYLRGFGDKGTGLTLMIGSLLLIYGIMIFGYMIAAVYQQSTTAMPQVIIIALITVSAITGWYTNLNYMSLHRFYRDRLAEAFMPDYPTTRIGENAPADGADSLPIAAPAHGADSEPVASPAPAGGMEPRSLNLSCKKGLYHIINANLILDRSRLRKYRSRGGDSFILSPLYCGSNATGWERSTHFAGGELTLASAMAISGAAANPRSGMVGTGITRNGLVSLAMSLLGLRLGYWVARPLKEGEQPGWRMDATRRANHFFPSALYALKFGYSETSNFLELTDGGHFENLGLYELVRRRCGLIIICDGGQDPDSSYQSLTFAALRIKEDFGALLKFNVSLKTGTLEDETRVLTSPGELVAREASNEFPKDAEFASRGFFLASVDYGARGGGVWPQTGLIIYMKSAMISDLGLVARGYKGAHPEFPYQSTSDQLFETDQFEAYREVGHKICAQMLKQTRLDDLFKTHGSTRSRPPLGRLQDSEREAIRIEKDLP